MCPYFQVLPSKRQRLEQEVARSVDAVAETLKLLKAEVERVGEQVLGALEAERDRLRAENAELQATLDSLGEKGGGE